MSGRDDARTVTGFCAGQGVPGSQISYCRCAIWRAQRDADWAARRGPDALRDEQAVRFDRTYPALEEAMEVDPDAFPMAQRAAV